MTDQRKRTKPIAAGDLRLKFGFKGRVVARGEPDYEQLAFGGLWNRRVPARGPQLVARVRDEDDVVAAVRFANAVRIKIAVRGGGHNWAAPSLRNGGMMLDLSELNRVIALDVPARKAVVQPVLSNREIQAALNARGLAYPTGHCPPVKLSGYLLSGGMSWNQGVWGHGCESVEAIEMVTANGETIVASKDRHHDYFWAARGAGPGMFAVCLRYHLKLYPVPKAITGSTYWYPYERLPEVAQWVERVAHELHKSVEFSIFLVEAPPELHAKARASHGKIVLVTGNCFADTPDEARARLAPLETCPVVADALAKSVNVPLTFENLFDLSGGLWPDNLRSKVDALFYAVGPAAPMAAMQEHFLAAPSPKTVFMFAVFTGKALPPPLPKDMALSMSGIMYGGAWTMWERAADDAANVAWHDKTEALMAPFVGGRYVGETDTTTHLDYSEKSFSRANWQRLARLRRKYDPNGVFYDWKEGLD